MKSQKESLFRELCKLQEEPWFQRALKMRGGAPLIALYLLARSYDFAENSYFEIRITKIAEKLGFERSTVSRIVSRLEKEGLFSRDLSFSNNRLALKLLQVTDDNLPIQKAKNKSSENLRSLKIEADKERDTVLPGGIGVRHENK